MIDIHNHLLIGVDDGPQNEEEALALMKQAMDNGITDIIVTPHQYSGDFINPKSKILEKMEEIKALIDEHDFALNVYPGQEIRINGELVQELESDINIPLNESQYVLVEFSFIELANYTEKLFFDLQMKGYTPLIAHPERCRPLMKEPDKLYDLIEKGAIAQVTATSVAGALGEGLQEKSLRLIENNLVHVVASDAHHASNRPFMLKEAYQVIEEQLDAEYVERLKYNAKAILHNRDLKVKPPKKWTSEDGIKKKRKKKKFLGLY